MPKAAISRSTGLDIQPDPKLTSSVHGFYVPQLTTAQIANIADDELRNGLMTYNPTTNNYQFLRNSILVNVNTSSNQASGVGLNGTPFFFPSGVNAAVEVAGNQVENFAYRGTTSNTLRIYLNAGWHTITTV